MHLLLILVVCLLPVETQSSMPHFRGEPGELCSASSCTCDGYQFCSDKNYEYYKEKLRQDFAKNKTFESVWNMAKNISKQDSRLKAEECTAVMAYTLNGIYKDFNSKTRNFISNLESDHYPYKGMHFFLSSAVHKLSDYRPKQVFRCSGNEHTNYNKNDKFVFTQFSSTTKDMSKAKEFGDYCFNITTVKGAEIQHLSYYREEKEILIPSCETFTVVEYSAKKKLVLLRSTTSPKSVQTRRKRSTDTQQYLGLPCGQKSQWKASWKIVFLFTMVTLIQILFETE